MLTLIKVELKKIFHKKSIYMIWILMFIFCLFNNILYKTDYDEDGNYKYFKQENLKEEAQKLQEELTKYHKENESEVSMYITLQTKLDIITLKKKFSSTSWQYQKINNYLYDLIYQLNTTKYLENKENSSLYQEYQTILKNLEEDNWQYFLKLEKNNLKQTITDLTAQLQTTTDKKDKLSLESQLEEHQFKLKILNYRLQNQIKEDSSYLNQALETFQENYKIVTSYQDNKSSRNHDQELQYQNALSNLKINQYIIEHKQNINKQNTLNYQLRTILEDYEIFFVILILILSGTILCDEFKDGTIKLLLIKPYSRGKILLSKYFTIIIVMAISILGLIIFQLLTGGLIFGLDSLTIPVVVYNFNQSKVIEYSVIEYMGIRILTRIPFYLILMILAMTIGILSNSSILSITLPLILYMFTPSLQLLASQYQLTFMKYFVNINWNLQEYLFGKISEIPFLTLKDSIIILIVYFISFGILTYQIFKKKNIKNI